MSIELEVVVRGADCRVPEIVGLELSIRIESWWFGAIGPSLHSVP